MSFKEPFAGQLRHTDDSIPPTHSISFCSGRDGRIFHELDSSRDLDIPIALVLVEFNVVPSLELQKLKEHSSSSPTIDTLAFTSRPAHLVVRHLAGLVRTLVRIIWSHAALQHAVDLDGMLVPLGFTRDGYISGILARFVVAVADNVFKIVAKSKRKARLLTGRTCKSEKGEESKAKRKQMRI